MQETRRENWALWIGIFATIIPGLMVAGFMPEWNVLPVSGWVSIAAVGSAIAGAIATPLWVRGAICGMAAGVGALLGIWLYVLVRSAIFGGNTFLKIELLIGAGLGALPGFVLYHVWARGAQSEAEGSGQVRDA